MAGKRNETRTTNPVEQSGKITLFAAVVLLVLWTNFASAQHTSTQTEGMKFAMPKNSFNTAYPLAIRSNLLFDLVGGLNVGVEVPFEKYYSIAADFAYAYWSIDDTYALETTQVGIEGKYWFDQGNMPLTGWNAGLYGTYGGRYDVQWGRGYQGNGFWSAGVVGGYSMPVSQRLIFDFSVGVGYFFTPEVRRYTHPDGGPLIWDETRYNVGRFTLTKAKVNLVWLIGVKKNRK